MNEVVDLSFVDRLDEIMARRDQLTESIRENCRIKTSRAFDLLEIAIEEAARLIKRRADATLELAAMDEIAKSLELQVATMRSAVARLADEPTPEFWTAAE